MRSVFMYFLILFTFVTPLHAEIVTVSDGDFANWTFTSLASNNGSATGTVVGDGNPGVCVNITTETPDWGDIGWGIAMNEEFIWNPVERGPISSLRMEIDVKCLTITPHFTDGQGFHLVAFQDGRMYGAPISRDDSNEHVYWNEVCLTGQPESWNRFSLPAFSTDSFAEMTHADPGLWDFDSRPDFSTNGSPLRFGFAAANHISKTRIFLYDNWELTIVPEPSVLGLLCVGLLGLLIRRR